MGGGKHEEGGLIEERERIAYQVNRYSFQSPQKNRDCAAAIYYNHGKILSG